ncbi:MAG: hypothetical protein ACD_15C00176G0009 [uncultured bacterium]|nr:MAG: hypothetical protein ACD_15C00176G0009 [uncultured bacterium]HCU71132.1 hypothetical protein [Candidatus Moranbacteria bacterium]
METKIYYLLALVIWSIPWKGFALWKSARRGESIWFIFLLLLNTAGILEIAYLFFFSNKEKIPSRKERPFDINPY